MVVNPCFATAGCVCSVVMVAALLQHMLVVTALLAHVLVLVAGGGAWTRVD